MGTGHSNTGEAPSDASALQVYEQRLKTLLELSSEWYWEQDENHRFSLIVGARLDQMGIDQQQYLGTARWDHDTVPVGDGGSWDDHKAQIEARQPFTRLVYSRVDSQGEVHYISASGRPRFEGPRFVGYCGIARDVTASMRAEQLLRLEHMVARCVAGAESVDTALKAVIRSVCETPELVNNRRRRDGEHDQQRRSQRGFLKRDRSLMNASAEG